MYPVFKGLYKKMQTEKGKKDDQGHPHGMPGSLVPFSTFYSP